MRKKESPPKGVERIIALGKQKGYLTYDEVNDLLPEEVSSSDEIDKIFEMLGNEDIQLVETEGEVVAEKHVAQAVKEEGGFDHLKEAERFLPLDDPVKMYLKQMGSICAALPRKRNRSGKEDRGRGGPLQEGGAGHPLCPLGHVPGCGFCGAGKA